MEAAMKTRSASLMIPIALAFSLALSAALLSLGAPAQGQSAPAQGQTPTVPVQPKINLSLEQRHVIKELIKDLNISPASQKIETTVGTTVPATINLSPMPQVVSEKIPQVKSHLFFLEDGKVVIVDPKENKIVDAID
jgi:Protein of unknown function (DUF1236)